jgi:hypothetical protein
MAAGSSGSRKQRSIIPAQRIGLLEKLRDLRRSVDRGVERLQDPERADLYDCLSDWLVHAFSEQTQPPTIKTH